MTRRFAFTLILGLLLGALVIGASTTRAVSVKATQTPSRTATLSATPSETATATDTETPGPSPTDTDTPTPSDTPTATDTPTETGTPTETPTPSATPVYIEPYPSAPLCEGEHDRSIFHTLWNSVEGCHYDHEHGADPFTSEVAAAFPGFDLFALLGNVQVGHTNPSSEMENTHKHGGFKWQATLSCSPACPVPTGVSIGVNAAVIQYHGLGDYSIEFESRIHSALALLRQFKASNPTDYGYIFVNQHQDYGQRVAPYQGSILPYPDTPNPAYASILKPYFFIECFGLTPPCDKYPSRQHIIDNNLESNSAWASDPFSTYPASGSKLFNLIFRLRDAYKILDGNNLTYPFDFRWLCSSDDGDTYNPAACRYNNTTTQVHQVDGEIPAAWDNLAGFDTDSRVGRITAEGFVTRFGDLNQNCVVPGIDCHPLKLVEAFVDAYEGLFYTKVQVANPISKPERDIYFCGGVVCLETSPGAVPSGWIGSEN